MKTIEERVIEYLRCPDLSYAGLTNLLNHLAKDQIEACAAAARSVIHHPPDDCGICEEAEDAALRIERLLK